MATMTAGLLDLTAADLMTREVIRIPHTMRLRDAARVLMQNQVGGAPVVNEQGQCVGVLSAFDFLRLGADPVPECAPAHQNLLPKTCSFQNKRRLADGAEVTTCTLAPGVCSIQTRHVEPGGEEMQICRQPHCVLADWQVVEVEQLPTDEVRRFMTPDPVTAGPDTSIRALARSMIDAHIHRVIVVNPERQPVGIVSSTDLLAAVAYAVHD